MPFSYPATSIFNPAGGYMVVWSQEEFDSRIAEGWTEEPQPVEAFAPPAEPAPSKNKKK